MAIERYHITLFAKWDSLADSINKALLIPNIEMNNMILTSEHNGQLLEHSLH